MILIVVELKGLLSCGSCYWFRFILGFNHSRTNRETACTVARSNLAILYQVTILYIMKMTNTGINHRYIYCKFHENTVHSVAK